MIEKLLIGELPPDCAPLLARLHDHWRSLHPAEGGLPGRQHFDPTAIPQLLPHLWLLDVTRDPLRFRWRLLGAIHAEAMKGNHVGRWVDEVVPHFTASPHYRQYVEAVERGVIAYRSGRPMVRVDRDFMWVETMILPFARDGRTVDMLLGAVAVR